MLLVTALISPLLDYLLYCMSSWLPASSPSVSPRRSYCYTDTSTTGIQGLAPFVSPPPPPPPVACQFGQGDEALPFRTLLLFLVTSTMSMTGSICGDGTVCEFLSHKLSSEQGPEK